MLVRFTKFGVDHTWIVECKKWRTRVGKAEVLVLQGVVADVGADRGFLLSEEGFQSGAIASSRWTNVTLTNLEDLTLAAADDVYIEKLAAAGRRLATITRRMHALTPCTGLHRRHAPEGLDPDTVIEVHADAYELGVQMQRALASQSMHTRDGVLLAGPERLVAELEQRLEHLDAAVAGLAEIAEAAAVSASLAVDDLYSAIKAFFEEVTTSIQERSSRPDASEVALTRAVIAMRQIAVAANCAREGCPPPGLPALSALMRHLIDRTYAVAAMPDLNEAVLAAERDTVQLLFRQFADGLAG